jgi:hypothetical protein
MCRDINGPEIHLDNKFATWLDGELLVELFLCLGEGGQTARKKYNQGRFHNPINIDPQPVKMFQENPQTAGFLPLYVRFAD